MISVVIPVFNGLEYIERALKSVHGDIPYEIIIVIDDQHSLDEYRRAVRDRPEVTFIRNKKNMGVTFSRNKGYFAANGEVVVFLDVDDYFQASLDQIWKVCQSKLASVYLFRCQSDDGLTIGEPSRDEGSITSPFDEVIRMNNRGERLLAVRKNINQYPPFLAQTRGHEMAGLIRFSSGQLNARVFYSNIVARRYTQDNVRSLSKLRNSHSASIAIGHFVVSRYLLSIGKITAIKWYAKGCFRKFFQLW
jgi:glycosyltransferase involved in cell wall biosynthesis